MKLSMLPLIRNLLVCSLPVAMLLLMPSCQTTQRGPDIESMRYHPPQPMAKQVARVAYLNVPAGFVLLEVTPGYEATANRIARHTTRAPDRGTLVMVR